MSQCLSKKLEKDHRGREAVKQAGRMLQADICCPPVQQDESVNQRRSG